MIIDQLTQDGVGYFEFDDPAGNGHYLVHVALYNWLLDRIDNLAAPQAKPPSKETNTLKNSVL